MDLTRRTFLKVGGTAAASAVAAGPVGVTTAAGSREIALAAGRGPYLVIGEGGVLDLCGNYHDAVHQAAVWRYTARTQAYHIRCSPTLMARLKRDPSSAWVEIDGRGMTPDEATTRGFDVLRRAKDPDSARHALWKYHLESLFTQIDAEDIAAPETRWYAARNGFPVVVRDEKRSEAEPFEMFGCTPALAVALRNALRDGKPLPDIDKSFMRHMLAEECRTRLQNDRRFAIAVTQPDEVHLPFDMSDADMTVQMTLRTDSGWLLPYEGEMAERVSVSTHLKKSIETNGFAMPGFWHEVRGVRHHIDEFADTVPAPSLLGTRVRHQNRHT